MIFEGDSLTALGYPEMVRTIRNVSSDRYFNAGRGGSKLLVAASGTSPSALDQGVTEIDPAYSGSYAKNIVIMWSGSNDLFTGADVADIEAGLTTWCNARKAAHPDIKIILCTYLPRYESREENRLALNAWIRANYATIADGLADIGADPTIGQYGDQNNETYYDVDHVHCNATGFAIVAGIVADAIESL